MSIFEYVRQVIDNNSLKVQEIKGMITTVRALRSQEEKESKTQTSKGKVTFAQL